MSAFRCVDNCGAAVSKKGGRCRTCAGRLRQKKPAARSQAEKGAGRPSKSPASGGKKESPMTGGGVGGVTEALTAAGYHVVEASIVEATIQVRLTAPPATKEKGRG